MADTSIPISDTTLARLRELARWAGISVNEALDRAIKDQYDRQFWPATDAGYAALRADPVAWAEMEAERRSMDGTLMDGLDLTERWTEQQRDLPPIAQEQTP